MTVTLGVLSVQGDVEENLGAARQALAEMNMSGEAVRVNTPSAVSAVDAIIIPGGESTTIGRLSMAGDTLAALRERLNSGMPALGICAGLILLSSQVYDRRMGATGQPLLGVLDVRLERNSFGRQRRSFEMDIDMEPLGITGFRGVFIRAPSVTAVSPEVEVLASVDGRIVAVRRGGIVGTSFHPEMSGNAALHRNLVDAARR
ncbi:MAG: pyridoxal 5'-phosphate synthase glutaminase subunit PdxT [Thaumarchaeota archaeon]|nr:pyridoxal 5'-phosphate synthase glutaminase subunit PdxT [Nitrososphaerota archaeon]